MPRFIPLRPEPAGSRASQVRVTCSETKETLWWNDAASRGWVSDSHGAPFQTYYSPAGLAAVGDAEHPVRRASLALQQVGKL